MNNKLLKSWGNVEVRTTSINNISSNKPCQLDIGNLNSYGDCCLPLQKISTIEKNFRKMYPESLEWEKIVKEIDPKNNYQSELSNRLGLKKW